jgi:hypothetical protein
MTKRNYIRRKKCLTDSTALVKFTLTFIHDTLRTNVSSDKLEGLAKQHASAIEAVCWDPRTHLTDNTYQKLMISKTRELCIALIWQYLPEPNAARIVSELRKLNLFPPSQEQTLPIPMIGRVDGAEGNTGLWGNLETFDELSRLKFEHPDLFYDGDGCHDGIGDWAVE